MDQSLLSLWRQRYLRAVRIAGHLRAVPFIRMVGLNGSMVTNRMNSQSDIDFYIVTAKNRLYLTRTLVTMAVHLTGWRRYGQKIRGRVCLNRFATEEALSIYPHNEYHARVFSKLAPIFAVKDTYQQYLQANSWMKNQGYPIHKYRTAKLGFNLLVGCRVLGEWLLAGAVGDILDRWLGRWQRQRILNDPRTKAAGSLVYVRKNELCFHVNKKDVS